MERLYIIKAENAGNLSVCLTFSDNTMQTVDIGEFIRRHPHPQYNKYLDPRKFSRFAIENGCIVLEQLHAGGGYVIHSMCGWSKRKGGEPRPRMSARLPALFIQNPVM